MKEFRKSRRSAQAHGVSRGLKSNERKQKKENLK